MDPARIAALLQPFTAGLELPPLLLEQLQLYLDLLLRWNARINLTAVRDPEQIVTRHFGESLFAARVLLNPAAEPPAAFSTLADLGSGAGFPGIPIKLLAPQIHLTLIESQTKKAVFLREVLRALKLDNAEVFCGRAEQWNRTADVVTLRAVEKFEQTLPVASDLVAPGGRLALLIGERQLPKAHQILAAPFVWQSPIAIPESRGRVLAVAFKS